LILLTVAACSGNPADSEPGPTPADTNDPDASQVIPLDGRGGGILAYTHQPGSDGGIHVIWAMNADGTGNTRITNASIGLNHHEWSPDAQRLAAVGYVGANNDTWSIHVFDSDGSNLVRLTHAPGVWDTEPSWSPDGSMIAFTRMYPSEDFRSELWLMNSDGSDQHWIGVEGFAAKWAPDGNRFVFVSNPRGNADLRTCRIDGTDVRQLLATASVETTPEWSPDGEEVAFTSNADGDHDIYVMNADGTNIRQLTTNTANDYTPRWSPDGSQIAFDSDLSGSQHWEVYLVNADGSNVRRITHTTEPATSINPEWRPTFLGEERPLEAAIPFATSTIPGGYLLHGSLTFSPASDEVFWSAFLNDGPEETLFFSTFDGRHLSTPERIDHLADLNDHAPAFSADGNTLFFSSWKPYPNADSDSLYGIWYVERTGNAWGEPQPVVATLDIMRTAGQVSVAKNGNLYFAGRLLNETEPRLYRSELVGGSYQTPQPLTGAISGENAVDPYVDPDERFLLYAVYMRGDTYGLIDIYVSHRQEDGSWSAAVNLGNRVNTEHFERFPSMSRDGKYLFFTRCTGNQFPDAQTRYYWIDVRGLEQLRD
jgi:TolB protein